MDIKLTAAQNKKARELAATEYQLCPSGTGAGARASAWYRVVDALVAKGLAKRNREVARATDACRSWAKETE